MFNVNKEALENKLGYNIISDQEPLGVISEQYRKLRTNIEYSNFNEDYKVLNITSTFKGEGKSVTVLNLGVVYAQSNLKTLIIDMDIRRPKIHRGFNLSNQKGLTLLAKDDTDPSQMIQSVSPYLDILPAGEKLPYPSEFLMSKRVKAFINKLKESYDKIIIDTPPITAVADANIINNIVDGTILVIGSRRSSLDDVKTAVHQLKENGGNLIGTVLTRVAKKDNKYMHYYEYKD